MIKEAESNADADKERRESVEARNAAEAMVHSAEKSLAEHGDKVGEDDKAAIEAAIADLKSALEGEDTAEIEAKSKELAEASMKLGEAMYAAAQAEAEKEADADAAADSADDDVVDADFEEVADDDVDDDQKKSA